MSAAKQLNANLAVTAALAGAKYATETVSGKVRAISDAHGDKLVKLKEHPYVAKIVATTELFWAMLGFVLIIHGSQFKNLFLCTQVLHGFCYARVKSSILVLYSDVTSAIGKVFEDAPDATKEDPDAKKEPAENKHAKKRAGKDKDTGKAPERNREEDAATAKKMLKVVDTDKVTACVFEVCVALMACHMVMHSALAQKALLTHVLVQATKDLIKSFLDFSEHDDMQVWLDLFLSFVLYSFFGGMAAIYTPLAFALNLGVVGSQLVVRHSLRAAEGMNRLKGETAEAVATGLKGLAAFAILAAFGSLWQFWALVADSGVAWYFQLMYLPAFIAEAVISVF